MDDDTRREAIRKDLELRQSYAAIFMASEAGRIVLDDLRQFCRGDSTTVCYNSHGIDVNATMMAEGRREVWLRICAVTQRDPHTGAEIDRN